MIIWGGFNGGNLNTGGKYNPSSDTWITTSSINAPSARSSFAGIWTGIEMIVWGGAGGGYLNTGGKYSPSSDMWTATSTTNAPAGRYLHSAIWTGNEMIIWGGLDSTSYTSSGGRYCINAVLAPRRNS